MRSIPYLETNDTNTNKVFRMAVGDIVSNIIPFKDGLMKQEDEVIMAGMDYVTPWTRDASINTWNGVGLLFPEVTKNTLLSVLGDFDGTIRITGEYWDAIIWAIGAWSQYLYTGDKDFLKTSYNAIENSLKFFEDTEFSPEFNLFRGGACYGDGISAYPDRYLTDKKLPGIIHWPMENPEMAAKPGVGVTTHVLSTNCLYYLAYIIMGKMVVELDIQEVLSWEDKAEKMKNAINKELWDDEAGKYNYFVDKFGGCNFQEGMGQSFAILFGIADEDKVEKIFKNTYVAEKGIPCVWPTFERYETKDGNGYGRHSGTVWPHIQGFWAHAAAMCGKGEIFKHELNTLIENVARDSHFAEIYHPVTGETYGGRQEWMENGIVEWKSCIRQTWSATAYLRMVIMGMLGMEFSPKGIKFKPLILQEYKKVHLTGLRYRDMILDIKITGYGTEIKEFRIDGVAHTSCELSSMGKGCVKIDIIMTNY